MLLQAAIFADVSDGMEEAVVIACKRKRSHNTPRATAEHAKLGRRGACTRNFLAEHDARSISQHIRHVFVRDAIVLQLWVDVFVLQNAGERIY